MEDPIDGVVPASMALFLNDPATLHTVQHRGEPFLFILLQDDLQPCHIVDDLLSHAVDGAAEAQILDETFFGEEKFPEHLFGRGNQVIPADTDLPGTLLCKGIRVSPDGVENTVYQAPGSFLRQSPYPFDPR
jgi:hypothetical protein